MRVVIDIEADALVNPKNIWLICCKDIDTNEYHIFRNITSDPIERDRFVTFYGRSKYRIGHNLLGYDAPVLQALLGIAVCDPGTVELDTLILSKLIDYSRQGHSIEDYGLEFGIPKGKFVDFSKYSQEMEDYCVRDVDICHRIYSKYHKYISNPAHTRSIQLEHRFQIVVNDLHTNGFSFNTNKANKLLEKVEEDLAVLDKDILLAFPPRLRLIREITPKETKYGTLSKTDFRWLSDGDITEYNGGPFCRCSWECFNPASHKQIISVLSDAGWRPVDRTQSHIETEREINRLRYNKGNTPLDIRKKELTIKLEGLKKTGWKVNEANLETLPLTAPIAARLLAKRILLEARRRTLTEWLNLVCFEIKIDNASIDVLGHVIKDHLIQSGVPRNKNIINKDIEKEILKSLDALCCKSLGTTNKKSGNVGTTLEIPTIFLLKTLIEWLKSKKINVRFVDAKDVWSSITVMPPEKSEGCSVLDAMSVLDGMKQNGLKFSITSERIKGRFYGLGAWTHRMAHQAPNTANIPNAVRVSDGSKTLLGKELRSLWCAPKNRLLVGVDAEAIQLRVFAHLINDPALIDAIVNGKKSEGTDPHSLNKVYFGDYCKTRNAAKHSLYAMFFGGKGNKIAEIMGCLKEEAEEAIEALVKKYPGLQRLQQEVFPVDAKRGYFIGLDGRKVKIPGDTVSQRRHLCMSGHLQNGEKVIMSAASVEFSPKLKEYDSFLVNLVHDEWQTETPNNMQIALSVAKLQTDALEKVGRDLNLNLPITGSYYNDDDKDYTIATNWSKTH